MLYAEPESARFINALQRLKAEKRRRESQTRIAKQRIRELVRKHR